MSNSDRTENGLEALSDEVRGVLARLVELMREAEIPVTAVHFLHDPGIVEMDVHYLDDSPAGGYVVGEQLAPVPYVLVALSADSEPVGLVLDVDKGVGDEDEK